MRQYSIFEIEQMQNIKIDRKNIKDGIKYYKLGFETSDNLYKNLKKFSFLNLYSLFVKIRDEFCQFGMNKCHF